MILNEFILIYRALQHQSPIFYSKKTAPWIHDLINIYLKIAPHQIKNHLLYIEKNLRAKEYYKVMTHGDEATIDNTYQLALAYFFHSRLRQKFPKSSYFENATAAMSLIVRSPARARRTE